MTTTIANAKQVKIDMQRRVEMNSKRNDTADMNSSQKLQQSQFRQHAMMTMASTGVTTTTTTTTIAKNNTAYPHVSIIKKEKDAVPVPVIFPVIPKQHKKPPYVHINIYHVSCSNTHTHTHTHTNKQNNFQVRPESPSSQKGKEILND